MKKPLIIFLICSQYANAQPLPEHNLSWRELPTRWDEAFPMGNAILGALLWQKTPQTLRLALDRADLWDTRPMENMDDPQLNYQWIAQQLRQNNYREVQEKLDAPYDRQAGPSKIPAAALEFFYGEKKVQNCSLNISNGLTTVDFEDGSRFETFVHADRREGWFRWTKKSSKVAFLPPQIVQPPYVSIEKDLGTQALARLGYPLGGLEKHKNGQVYHQPAWGGFSYQVAVFHRPTADGLEGVWCISSHFPEAMWAEKAEKTAQNALKRGFSKSFNESEKWWRNFWQQSSLRLPDAQLDRQYHLEHYKFACLARPNAPAISLQGIWTADQNSLPPWKGDFHHDLNTQMTYWHALTANQANLAQGYLRFIKSNEKAHRAWTERYFGTPGLNVPGVETLRGEPMGGWIQYACSPTTVAWLAVHFYQYWQFTRDESFLKNEAFPFLEAAAIHLEALTIWDSSRTKPVRLLPLSSSPEINDNDASAWFPNTWTNHDLSLAQFLFEKTALLAAELGKTDRAEHWQNIRASLPELATTEAGDLKFAENLPYEHSHRHFSHLMAIYPLGTLDVAQGVEEQKTIEKSLEILQKVGSSQWTGYSFAWKACLAARARDAEGALLALKIFAEAFVSKNSFHLNGDQSGKGYSQLTYRPFTLEGNFAFAAGVQEMLLQSNESRASIFPALPEAWQTVQFDNFRAFGGAHISAKMKAGRCVWVKVISEKTPYLTLELPAGDWTFISKKGKWKLLRHKGNVLEMSGLGEVHFLPK